MALGLVLPALALARSPWLDETITLSIVRSADWSEWLAAFRVDHQPPAYSLLLTVWAQITDALPWLRAFSIAAALGAVVLAMRWAGQATRAAAPLCGLLLITSPVVLRYAVELRPYALLLLATAWAGTAVTTLANHPATRRRQELSLGLALALAALTHFTGVLLAPAIGAYALTARHLSRPCRHCPPRMTRLPWLAVASAVVVSVLAFVLKGSPVLRSPGDWWMPPLDPSLALTTAGELLGLAPPGTPPPGPPAVIGVLLGLGGIFAVARASASRWLPPLVMAATCWLGVAAISLAWLPIWWPRILIPGLLPLAVAVGIAASSLSGRVWRVGVTAAIVAASTLAAGRWIARDARVPLEDWPAVIADLGVQDGRVPILCLPGYAALALTAGQRLDPSRLQRIDVGQPEDQISAAVSTALMSDGAGLGLVVRVDLTLARDVDAVRRVAEAVRRHATRPVRLDVGIVTSPDVGLVPSLTGVAEAAEASLLGVLGPPVERVGNDRAFRLAFAVPPAGR